MNFKENLIKDLEENDMFLSLSPYQRMTIAEIADKQLRISVVGRWRFLNERSDFEEMPKEGNFKCLFDDGTECNFHDEHPIAIMIAWKPL